MRARKRRAQLLAMLCVVPCLMPLSSRAADPCVPVERQFKALMERYLAAGRHAIETDEPGDALDKARKAAIAGEIAPTITIVGIGLLMRSQSHLFQLSSLRQICGFAGRNQHPLHVAACAYFNALNPIGDPREKRDAVEREISRFAELPASESKDAGLSLAMRDLEACIATLPLPATP